jgi:hypothetical protein
VSKAESTSRIHSRPAICELNWMVPCSCRSERKTEICSVFVNRFMNLFSASEDLAIRTLKHLPGALARLLYLVTLRDKDGNYRHWGMAQVFGDEASMQAAREAHKEAFNEILRTPLQKLWSELANPGRSDAPVPEVQLRELAMAGRKLIPADCSEAAECHFNSVLHALRELAQSSAGTSNRPAA